MRNNGRDYDLFRADLTEEERKEAEAKFLEWLKRTMRESEGE